MNFDIRKNGLRFGPHTTEELKELLAGGRVDTEDTVIKESGEEVSVAVFLGVPSERYFKPITRQWRDKPDNYVEPAGNLRWIALGMGLVWFVLVYWIYSQKRGVDGEFPLASALGETLGLLLGVSFMTLVIRLYTRKPGIPRAICYSFIVVLSVRFIAVLVVLFFVLLSVLQHQR